MVERSLEHVGIIPDGNRRWARAHRMPYEEAYLVSVRVLGRMIRDFVRFAPTVKTLVVYMMSRRNLARPREDMAAVLKAEIAFCRQVVPGLCDELEARVVPVGLTGLERELARHASREAAREYVEAFQWAGLQRGGRSARRIYLLAGYDPFDEIRQALANRPARTLSLQRLLVPVSLDLVVRTANEHRISDFVPLQCGYAEFVFIDKLFQDVAAGDVRSAVRTYFARGRSFGA